MCVCLFAMLIKYYVPLKTAICWETVGALTVIGLHVQLSACCYFVGAAAKTTKSGQKTAETIAKKKNRQERRAAKVNFCFCVRGTAREREMEGGRASNLLTCLSNCLRLDVPSSYSSSCRCNIITPSCRLSLAPAHRKALQL